jgi:hypothetical protein
MSNIEVGNWEERVAILDTVAQSASQLSGVCDGGGALYRVASNGTCEASNWLSSNRNQNRMLVKINRC